MKLIPKAEAQWYMNELMNSTAYIDPDTGVVYDPDVMPDDPDPDHEGN